MWPFDRREREREKNKALSGVLHALASKSATYDDHRGFIGAQPLSLMNAIEMSRERYRNDDYRHCRIGKITMKG